MTKNSTNRNTPLASRPGATRFEPLSAYRVPQKGRASATDSRGHIDRQVAHSGRPAIDLSRPQLPSMPSPVFRSVVKYCIGVWGTRTTASQNAKTPAMTGLLRGCQVGRLSWDSGLNRVAAWFVTQPYACFVWRSVPRGETHAE